MKGEAEAYAIEVKAKAEAEQVRDYLLRGQGQGSQGSQGQGQGRACESLPSFAKDQFKWNKDMKKAEQAKRTSAKLYNYVTNMNLCVSAQMAKKADAWKEYEEAALVDMMLKVAEKP